MTLLQYMERTKNLDYESLPEVVKETSGLCLIGDGPNASHKILNSEELKITSNHNASPMFDIDSATINTVIEVRTSFGSLFHLLCYVAMICNGNIDTIVDTSSELT